MGWSIRKSLSAGPIRLNFSKSGVGISGGIKGMRVGVGPRGITTSAGMGGIYYRKNWSGKTGSRADSGSEVSIEATDGQESISAVLFSETQINQQNISINFVLRESYKKYWVCVGILIILPLLSMYYQSKYAHIKEPAAVVTLLTFLYIPFDWVKRKINKFRAQNLLKRLIKRVLVNNKINIEVLTEIVAKTRLKGVYKDYALFMFYKKYLEIILSDQEIASSEGEELIKVERILALRSEASNKIRRWIFNQAYLEIVADGKLSQAEDDNIQRAKEILKLSDEDVSSEVSTLKILREVRDIGKNKLLPVDVTVNLDDKEVCYHQTKCRILKEKVVRTYQSQGIRYKDKDFGIDKGGDLFLTSNRIIIVGEGVQSIDLKKILNIETDLDKNLIRLDIDKRKTQIQMTVPDSSIFSAKLNKICEESLKM